MSFSFFIVSGFSSSNKRAVITGLYSIFSENNDRSKKCRISSTKSLKRRKGVCYLILQPRLNPRALASITIYAPGLYSLIFDFRQKSFQIISYCFPEKIVKCPFLYLYIFIIRKFHKVYFASRSAGINKRKIKERTVTEKIDYIILFKLAVTKLSTAFHKKLKFLVND